MAGPIRHLPRYRLSPEFPSTKDTQFGRSADSVMLDMRNTLMTYQPRFTLMNLVIKPIGRTNGVARSAISLSMWTGHQQPICYPTWVAAMWANGKNQPPHSLSPQGTSPALINVDLADRLAVRAEGKNRIPATSRRRSRSWASPATSKDLNSWRRKARTALSLFCLPRPINSARSRYVEEGGRQWHIACFDEERV
jgi:hypothetical protein